MPEDAIPGLVIPDAFAGMGAGAHGPMAKAARVTLEALRDAGSLEPRHSVLVQLVLSMAQAVDRGVTSGRASAAAMAAKQLLETMLVLDPPPEGPTAGDARAQLDLFFTRVEQAANGEVPA